MAVWRLVAPLITFWALASPGPGAGGDGGNVRGIIENYTVKQLELTEDGV